MIQVLLILISITLLFSKTVQAEIRELHTMSDLESFVDQDTLLIFDLDHTLFEATTAWGHISVFHHEIENGKKNGRDVKETIRRIYPGWVDSQKVCCMRPVEEEIPNIIQQLQKKKITTMGLTHRQVSVSLCALDHLSALDIDFEKTPIYDQQMDLKSFPHPVRYLEGVLFVADYNDKGEVLKAFLEEINYTPKRIVFIDDGMRNLISLEKAFPTVPFLGLHYRRLEHSHEHWNPEVAALQKKLYGTILSDQAVRCLLSHGSI